MTDTTTQDRDPDKPVWLCGDCSYRATGGTLHTQTDDEDAVCDWCGTDLNGSVDAVEQQDDPGPLPWQRKRDELAEWLEDHPHADDVRARKRNIDFTIGDMYEWPEYGNDDHINAIRSSSIALGLLYDGLISEVNIHLPPASDDLKDAVDAALDLPEPFVVVWGTFRLGTPTAPPEGLITPHVVATDDVDFDALRGVIEQCLACYEDVYEAGAKVERKHAGAGD